MRSGDKKKKASFDDAYPRKEQLGEETTFSPPTL